MAAAGDASLGPLEILVLHNLNHRERGKRLSDVCFMLNIEDAHTVNYAIKKLVRAGLVEGQKSGKEMLYAPSKTGRDLVEKYRDTRTQCLIDGLNMDGEEMREVAATLRRLSGIYDQAARAATSL